MLRVIALTAEVLVLALIGYNLVVALWGWRYPVPAPRAAGRWPLRVVIPAHNEAAVIGRLLDDLEEQTHENYSVWVIADRCSDRTVDLVSGRAAVDERRDGPDGKGAALAWHLDRHPLEPGEALVVLDADNRIPTELLARFAGELEAGGSVLQAYLDVSNPDASALTTAAALSYWASNRMVQLARRNLGWSADLGGTGMCLTGEALTAVGGFGTSPTEDQELVARLVLAGYRVEWLHDVRIRDEKPASLGVAVRQRTRWAGGKQIVARRYGPALVRLAIKDRSFGPVRSGRAAHPTGSDLPGITDRRPGGRCRPGSVGIPAGMVAVGRSGGCSGACSAAFSRPGRGVRPLPVALSPLDGLWPHVDPGSDPLPIPARVVPHPP